VILNGSENFSATKAMLTEVVVVQVTVVVVTGRAVTITPAECADDVDTLSDREIGTGKPGMDTCKQHFISFCCDKVPVLT
jgi:hypothetical protein